MRIVAHRGASADAPEHSRAAVREALYQGADGLEVDLRADARGRLWLLHDADFRRVAGDPRRLRRLDNPVAEPIDICAHLPGQPAEAPLPLEELLELWPAERPLWLELKEGPACVAELARRLADALHAVTLISFRADTLREARRRLDAPILWLRELDHPPTPRTLEGWLARCRKEHWQGLDLDRRGLSAAVAARVREAGLGLAAWTVDDPREAARLLDWGVETLTSNAPGCLREGLRTLGHV